jgi:hypothetical protein
MTYVRNIEHYIERNLIIIDRTYSSEGDRLDVHTCIFVI